MNTLSPWPFETPPPGIYFNMPFSEYCQIKCVNASMVKNLLVSPTDGWARSWMNPMNDEIDDDTKAKIDGRAYHKYILEGKDAFFDTYARTYKGDGDPSVLVTSEHIKAELKRLCLPVTFANKAEGAERVLSKNPTARIFDIEKAEYEQIHSAYELIDEKTMNHIELSAAMINFHPDLKKFFAGGYPEVTVIWDDPELGVRFKVRFDYLKIKPVSDLKTFANQYHENVDLAISKEMRRRNYHIQAYLYLRGQHIARSFAAQHIAGQAIRVFGDVDQDWLGDFSTDVTEEFWYVFMQKGIAPVARGKKVTLKDEAFRSLGLSDLTTATDSFKQNFTRYGTDAWIDLSPPETLSYSSMY